MRDTDLAWAAGFIDGEGCILINRRTRVQDRIHPEHALTLEVGQLDPLPLNKLQVLFGGTVRRRPDKRTKRASYVWVVRSRMAYEALVKLLPFLTNKRHQAEYGIEFQSLVGSTGKVPSPDNLARREFMFSELKAMKQSVY